MTRVKTFSCFFLILLPVICAAQQSPADSLKKIISSEKDDTNKVNTLIELSKNFLSTDAKQALQYANQANVLAEKLNFQNGKGWALKKIGQAYNQQSDYVNALQAWKEALAIFSTTGNKVGASNMLNNIGVIYYNKSMEDSAQDYYLKSLKVAEEIKDTLRIATALTNVGEFTATSRQPIIKRWNFTAML
jgi:tetratricopeptide (TPR) repeat protein